MTVADTTVYPPTTAASTTPNLYTTTCPTTVQPTTHTQLTTTPVYSLPGHSQKLIKALLKDDRLRKPKNGRKTRLQRAVNRQGNNVRAVVSKIWLLSTELLSGLKRWSGE